MINLMYRFDFIFVPYLLSYRLENMQPLRSEIQKISYPKWNYHEAVQLRVRS